MSSVPAISLEGVSFSYPSGTSVLCDVSLEIPEGQFVALTGANGAGKTTLARHLIGLLHPTEGVVHILGRNTTEHSVGQLARWVGFAFQNPEKQIFSPTVGEELAFGSRNLGLSGEALCEAIQRALNDFNLAAWSDYPPAALSFSIRRMVALASIAAMNTPILVLDEPTVGLDLHGTAHLVTWLKSRHKAGSTILLITHDMELAAQLAERVLVLHDRRLVADAPPAQIFHQTTLLAQAGLEPPFTFMLAERLGRPEFGQHVTPSELAQVLLKHLQEIA